MTIYDAVMAGLLVAGMVWGAWRGITWQLASIASLVLGYSVSHPLSAQLAPKFPGEPVVARALAMLVIYAAVSGGIFLAAWLVRATLWRMKFEAFDRHLGMLIGGLEAALLGMIATLFVVSLAPQTRTPIFASFSGRIVGQTMNLVGPVLPGEVRDALAPFWDGAGPGPGPPPGAHPRSRPPHWPGSRHPPRGPKAGRPAHRRRRSSRISSSKANPASAESLSRRPRRDYNRRVAGMTERLSVGDRPINLTQVLKLAGWVAHGGEAKALIADGMVRVNGEVETRKRKQMALGDVVELEGGPSLTSRVNPPGGPGPSPPSASGLALIDPPRSENPGAP